MRTEIREYRSAQQPQKTFIFRSSPLLLPIYKTTIVILYVTLLICILIVSEVVFRKSLTPFYKLLNWLNQFTLGGKNLPLDNPTKIKEFRRLNETILKMTRRNEEMYSQQKQFIENASHELQTPLAICRNKLELLAERPDCTEGQLEEIEDKIGRAHV